MTKDSESVRIEFSSQKGCPKMVLILCVESGADRRASQVVLKKGLEEIVDMTKIVPTSKKYKNRSYGLLQDTIYYGLLKIYQSWL